MEKKNEVLVLVINDPKFNNDNDLLLAYEFDNKSEGREEKFEKAGYTVLESFKIEPQRIAYLSKFSAGKEEAVSADGKLKIDSVRTILVGNESFIVEPFKAWDIDFIEFFQKADDELIPKIAEFGRLISKLYAANREIGDDEGICEAISTIEAALGMFIGEKMKGF